MKKVKYFNHDWDDNVIFMPTRIVFFSKNKELGLPEEIEVSTETFAKVRSKVGVESCELYLSLDNGVLVASESPTTTMINLLQYEVRNDDSTGSFRQFRDCEKEYFLRDLNTALTKKSFGPSFYDFVESCSTEESANNTTIITARGHAPSTMFKGLLLLKQMGLIKFCPPVQNIFPCSYKAPNSKSTVSAQNPSETKRDILISILDRINEIAANDNHSHSFGFSDDDHKTMSLVEKALVNEVQNGRWEHVEINLYFTGNKNKERNIVLSPRVKEAA